MNGADEEIDGQTDKRTEEQTDESIDGHHSKAKFIIVADTYTFH